MIIISKKFSLEKAIDNMLTIEDFFKNNPKRNVCYTELFTVRKGSVVRTILEHTLLTPELDKKLKGEI